jgi:hypothetical protein
MNSHKPGENGTTIGEAVAPAPKKKAPKKKAEKDRSCRRSKDRRIIFLTLNV